MKSIGISILLLFFAALFAAASSAQTAPAADITKVAIIDSSKFADPKVGIIKYLETIKAVETEFKPSRDEIKALETRLKIISDEYNKSLSADPKNAESKRAEAEKLQREYNYKVEQFQTNLNKRFSNVTGPIQTDIGNALAEYGKQKGFQILFDVSKDEKGILIWANMQTVDVTTDFIKFYNTRPVPTKR